MTRIRLARLAAAVLALCMAAAPAPAQDRGPVAVPSGVTYDYLGRWDTARLDRILMEDGPRFTGIAPDGTRARNAVHLFRVSHASVVPEHGNRPTRASGLLALPESAGAGSTPLPLVSYQHGTVYGKLEVPSHPENSPETQLMIARFAGRGYVLTGADYFGLGLSEEPEGYMVKGSHQQATQDMLAAARAVLAQRGVPVGPLFLAGWSQGGFVTLALLERLEEAGVPVRAAATASAPVDIFAALNGFLNFPRPDDATWVGTLFILSAFSFEAYYSQPGLARSVLAEAHYDNARRAWMRLPVDPDAIPTDLRQLIRPEYFDPGHFAASAYGRLVARTEAYRRVIRTPLRTYYGEADEAITTGVGRLAMTWQQAMGTGNPRVTAISTGPTSHRGTFGRALPLWQAWFDAP